ncbi:MAG: cell division topological specificity factor MinE, partial [Clostridiales bacterium]|nr:cell division topological specificity factor MinE [Clostridiales bacterium]
MLEKIRRLFLKEVAPSSKAIAKERLRLVLVHDRADLSETVMISLREDLIAVISKYMEIDLSALEVSLSKEDGSVALIANIPILNVKRDAEFMDMKPKEKEVKDKEIKEK